MSGRPWRGPRGLFLLLFLPFFALCRVCLLGGVGAPAPGLSWSRVRQATLERVRARACVHVFSGVHVCVCVCMRSMINKGSWPGRHAGSGRGCRRWAAAVRTATSTEDSRGGRAGGPRVEGRGWRATGGGQGRGRHLGRAAVEQGRDSLGHARAAPSLLALLLPVSRGVGAGAGRKGGVGEGGARGEVRRVPRMRVKEERVGRLLAVPVRLPSPRHAHAPNAILQTFPCTCLPPPLSCASARPRRSPRARGRGTATLLADGREGREVKPHRRCRGGRRRRSQRRRRRGRCVEAGRRAGRAGMTR